MEVAAYLTNRLRGRGIDKVAIGKRGWRAAQLKRWAQSVHTVLLIRRLLQIAFGLLILVVLFAIVKGPTRDFVGDTVLIGFLVSIILVLGPWWSSATETQNMRGFRRVLQAVFGVLVLAVLFTMVKSPTANLVADTAMIALFALVILVLGPVWSNAERIRNWSLRLDLPTDDPKIAKPLALAAMGVFSFFEAWSVHTQPNHRFVRFERLFALVSGPEGVAVAWLVVGASCLVAAWFGFGHLQTKPKNGG